MLLVLTGSATCLGAHTELHVPGDVVVDLTDRPTSEARAVARRNSIVDLVKVDGTGRSIGPGP